jgi:protein regulator of cytokinesis 1
MGEAVTAAELLYGMPLIRSVTGDGGGGVETTGGCGALLVELKVSY